PEEPIKEKVKIESSFKPILPPIEKVNSEVVIRKMTPEEVERLSKLGKQTTDSTGAKVVPYHNYFNKSAKEVVEMKTALTKELYLSEKAAGKGNAQIERDWNMKPNSLYPMLKKWETTSVNTDSPKQTTPPSTGIIIKPGKSGANAIDEGQEPKNLETAPVQNPVVDPKLTAILNYVRELAGPDPRSAIFELITVERQRQDILHPLSQFAHRMEILVEEVGEVAKAKLEGNQSELRKELIEVAAVAVRWVEILDREASE
ncbi:MAG: hypothetical protein JWM44_4396, partial [Bacilli bacterium]|nr:hypothetical protein [Bacilli bacterium]